MLTIRKALPLSQFICGAILLSGFIFPASAQTNPCGTPSSSMSPITVTGLTPVDSGHVVYDSNQGVCWLADANFAAEPQVQALLHPGSGISPNGTMDYLTAQKFVDLMNRFSYLGHSNWQLPNTPLDDRTCSAHKNGNFGVSCTGSALANLYNVGLDVGYPASVIPLFTNTVGPFQNLQPSLYWTSDTNAGGEVTFSFNSDVGGANTTKYNYIYVLPMTRNSIGTPPCCAGVLPYTSGAAAGLAVYDTATGYSWALDANLAASNTFGVSGTTTITSKVNKMTYIVPLIDSDGAMLFSSVADWIAGMQTAQYAGAKTWKLPTSKDLQALYTDLGLQAGATTALKSTATVGPFKNLQPGFYWSCERDPGGNAQSPCDYTLIPPGGLPYSFDFNDGFLGTDASGKQFYVMVYFPAPN
jgi:hypothetical protein